MWPFDRLARALRGLGGGRKAAEPETAQGEIASPADPVAAGDRGAVREWRTVPPVERTVQAMPLTVQTSRFEAGLASWQNLAALEPLGHAVSPDAPSGSVTGLARPSAVQRSVDMPVTTAPKQARRLGGIALPGTDSSSSPAQPELAPVQRSAAPAGDLAVSYEAASDTASQAASTSELVAQAAPESVAEQSIEPVAWEAGSAGGAGAPTTGLSSTGPGLSRLAVQRSTSTLAGTAASKAAPGVRAERPNPLTSASGAELPVVTVQLHAVQSHQSTQAIRQAATPITPATPAADQAETEPPARPSTPTEQSATAGYSPETSSRPADSVPVSESGTDVAPTLQAIQRTTASAPPPPEPRRFGLGEPMHVVPESNPAPEIDPFEPTPALGTQPPVQRTLATAGQDSAPAPRSRAVPASPATPGSDGPARFGGQVSPAGPASHDSTDSTSSADGSAVPTVDEPVASVAASPATPAESEGLAVQRSTTTEASGQPSVAPLIGSAEAAESQPALGDPGLVLSTAPIAMPLAGAPQWQSGAATTIQDASQEPVLQLTPEPGSTGGPEPAGAAEPIAAPEAAVTAAQDLPLAMSAEPLSVQPVLGTRPLQPLSLQRSVAGQAGGTADQATPQTPGAGIMPASGSGAGPTPLRSQPSVQRSLLPGMGSGAVQRQAGRAVTNGSTNGSSSSGSNGTNGRSNGTPAAPVFVQRFDLPGLPGASTLPDLPGLPSAPAMPDLPALPGVPGMPAMPVAPAGIPSSIRDVTRPIITSASGFADSANEAVSSAAGGLTDTVAGGMSDLTSGAGSAMNSVVAATGSATADELGPGGAPGPSGGGSSGVAGTASPKELDELSRQLYDRIRGRLRAELRLDRERAGLLTDPYR